MAYYDKEKGWIIAGQSDEEFIQSQNPMSYDEMVQSGMINSVEEQREFDNLDRLQEVNSNNAQSNQQEQPNQENNKEGQNVAHQIDEALGEYHRPTDKEYEKLNTWDTAVDVYKAVSTEASHIWNKKEDEAVYDERTHFAENAKYIYRYGAGTLLTYGLGSGLGALANAGKLPKIFKAGQAVTKWLTSPKLKYTGLVKGTKHYQAVTKTPLEKAVIENALALSGSNAVASFVLSRPEEHEENLIVKTNDDDNTFTYKLKKAADDTVLGMVLGAGMGAAGEMLKPVLKPVSDALVKNWKALFKLNNSKGEKAVTEASKEFIDSQAELNQVTAKTQLISQVNETINKAVEENIDDIERYLYNSDFVTAENKSDIETIYKAIQKGQTLKVNENGEYIVNVSKWQDASEISLEELANQLDNNGISFMNKAVEDVLRERKILKEGENLVTNIEKENGKTALEGNKAATENIVKYYQKKLGIDNKIKVEWKDGNIDGAEGVTKSITPGVKDKTITIQKKQLQIKSYNNRLKKLNDVEKIIGGQEQPKTIYNKETANKAKKDIINKIKELNGKRPSFETVAMRRKNQFFRKRIAGSREEYDVIQTEQKLYDLIDEIAKEPSIVLKDLEELDKRAEKILSLGGNPDLEEYMGKLAEKFYKAMELAFEYVDVGNDLKKSKGLKIKEDISLLKERIEIAQKELSNLQKPSKPNIVIQINKHTQNPYAVLRSELEHTRDIAKNEVPKDVNTKHFARYDGKNESEMSLRYVKKKADKRAGKLKEEEKPNLEENAIENAPIERSILNENTEVGINTPTTSKTLDSEPPVRGGKTLVNKGITPTEVKETIEETIEQSYGKVNQSVGEILDKAEQGINELAHFEKINWEGRSVKAEELNDFFKQFDFTDDTAIVKAINQGDINHLQYVANVSLVLTKRMQELQNKLIASNNPENDKLILNAINHISQTLDSVGSTMGSILQARKYVKKCSEVFSLTEAEKLGITSFSDVLKTEIKKLNFTINNPKELTKQINTLMETLRKKHPDVMNRLTNEPELYNEFQEQLISLVRSGKYTDKQVENLLENLVTARSVAKTKDYLKNATSDGLKGAAKFMKDAQTYYINNLLSSPQTQAKNITSGVLNTFLVPLEKIVGGALTGLNDKTMFYLTREGALQYACLFNNIKESFQMAVQAFKTGEGQLISIGRDTAIGEGRKSFQTMGSFIPETEGSTWLRSMAANIYQLPLRFMGATDEFITQLNYRAIVQAKAITQAERMAVELNLTGKAKKAFIQSKAEEGLISSFNLQGKPLDVYSYAQARDVTLQTPVSGKIWDYSTQSYVQVKPKTVMMSGAEYLQQAPEIFRFFFPFVRTPANVGQQGLERNLIYYLGRFASKDTREFFKEHPEQFALATGRVAVGTLGFMMACNLALLGIITGADPVDPNTRKALYATGWRPYSIRLPNGNYVSYRGIDPLYSTLGFAANSVHLITGFYNDENRTKHLQNYLYEGFRTLYDSYIDTTAFGSGINQLDTINQALDGNIDENSLINQFQGFLPLNSGVKWVYNVKNPEQTKPDGLEKLYNKYFNNGIGDYKRNVFGEVQNVYTGLLSKETESSEMLEDVEMQRLAEEGSFTPTILKDGENGNTFKYSEFKSNSYDRSLYDFMLDRMSKTEINGLTLRQAVRELVTSDEYQELPDGTLLDAKENNLAQYKRTDETKINAIKDIFEEYRSKAKIEVLEEYGDDFFNAEGISANEIKEIQYQNKVNRLLNEEIDQIRGFN